MKKLPIQPSEEMISAGIAELRELGLIQDAVYDGDLEEEELQDVVVFIWQAMLSNLK